VVKHNIAVKKLQCWQKMFIENNNISLSIFNNNTYLDNNLKISRYKRRNAIIIHKNNYAVDKKRIWKITICRSVCNNCTWMVYINNITYNLIRSHIFLIPCRHQRTLIEVQNPDFHHFIRSISWLKWNFLISLMHVWSCFTETKSLLLTVNTVFKKLGHSAELFFETRPTNKIRARLLLRGNYLYEKSLACDSWTFFFFFF